MHGWSCTLHFWLQRRAQGNTSCSGFQEGEAYYARWKRQLRGENVAENGGKILFFSITVIVFLLCLRKWIENVIRKKLVIGFESWMIPLFPSSWGRICYWSHRCYTCGLQILIVFYCGIANFVRQLTDLSLPPSRRTSWLLPCRNLLFLGLFPIAGPCEGEFRLAWICRGWWWTVICIWFQLAIGGQQFWLRR